MKTPKFTNPIAAISIIVLIFLSIIVFPLMLAATPENLELETIEPENTLPVENPDQNDEFGITDGQDDANDTIPDINAISKETAIAIVEDFYTALGETDYVCPSGNFGSVTQELRGARYIEASDHLSVPVWQVLYYWHKQGQSLLSVSDNSTPEEELAMILSTRGARINCDCYSWSIGSYADTGMSAIIQKRDYKILVVVEVDALTGDIIGIGEINCNNHSDKPVVFSYDEAIDWEMVKNLTIHREFPVSLVSATFPSTQANNNPGTEGIFESTDESIPTPEARP